jgi:hypothetical protein
MLKQHFVLKHPTHIYWPTIDCCLYNERSDSVLSDKSCNRESNEIVDILPLSKLALHAEGVPLILPNNAIIKNSNAFNNYFLCKEEDKSKLLRLNSIGTKNGKRNSECLFKGNDLFLSQRINHSWRSNTSNLKEKLIISSNIEKHSIDPIIDDYVSIKDSFLLNCNSDDVSICSSESSSSSISVDEITINNDMISSEISNGSKATNKSCCSDCLSITSEDSSSASDQSLPRVIKPRKRRKKDRHLSQLIPFITAESIKISNKFDKNLVILSKSSTFANKTLTSVSEVENTNTKCNEFFNRFFKDL